MSKSDRVYIRWNGKKYSARFSDRFGYDICKGYFKVGQRAEFPKLNIRVDKSYYDSFYQAAFYDVLSRECSPTEFVHINSERQPSVQLAVNDLREKLAHQLEVQKHSSRSMRSTLNK